MFPPVKKRYRASVVVCHQEKILAVRMKDPVSGVIRTYLPGGKIEKGEDPWRAARRECLEETGYTIIKSKKAAVRTASYLFEWGEVIHDCKTEFFRADLKDPEISPVAIFDDNEINLGVVWVPIARIAEVFSYHRTIRDVIMELCHLSPPTGPSRVLAAFANFRGTMSAEAACAAAAKVAANLGWRVGMLPLADGGRGSLDIWTSGLVRKKVSWRIMDLLSLDPLGRPVTVRVGISESKKPDVFIESADCLGLHHIDHPTSATAIAASSRGLGLVLKDLSRRLPARSHVIIAVGDSAVSDCGLGMLLALGAKVAIKSGEGVELVDPESFNSGMLGSVVSIHPPDGASVESPPDAVESARDWSVLKGFSWTILCDVQHDLTRAVEFCAQKGADAQTQESLRAGFINMSAIFSRGIDPDPADRRVKANRSGSTVDFSGASGGTAAAFHAVFGAKLKSGSRWLLEHSGIGQMILQSDLVITGEGSTDIQSVAGKAPVACIGYSVLSGVPVSLISGRVDLSGWPAWLRKQIPLHVASGLVPSPEASFSESVASVLKKFSAKTRSKKSLQRTANR